MGEIGKELGVSLVYSKTLHADDASFGECLGQGKSETPSRY